MKKYSPKFIEKTKKVWQPFNREKISDEDAEEIIDNFIQFIEFLMELDRKYNSVDSS